MIALIGVTFFLALVPAAEATVGLGVQSEQACSVTPGDYSITVTNNQEQEDTFRITSLGPHRSWVIFQNTRLELNPDETGTFRLTVAAPENAAPDFYDIPLRIYSDTNESLTEETSVCLIVKKVEEITVGNVSMTKGTVSPGETATLDVLIENTGTEPFRNVNLDLTVTGPGQIEFGGDTVTLFRGERKSLRRTLDVTNQLPPGEYTVQATLTKDEVPLDSRKSTFRIEKVKQIDRQVSEDSGLLTFSSETTLVNRGNTERTGTVTAEVSFPANSFVTTSGNPQAESADGGTVYRWQAALSPDESSTVSYTVHYWPFYVIALVVAYAVYRLYILTRRPTIKKRVVTSKELEDDKQEFTISVEIKNTTPVELDAVRIRDFVPLLGSVEKEFKIEPKEVNETDAGTEIIWEFPEMDPGDVRVVHYKITTVVGTVDFFKLPPAIVEGEKDGREYKVHSNEETVGSRKDVM